MRATRPPTGKRTRTPTVRTSGEKPPDRTPTDDQPEPGPHPVDEIHEIIALVECARFAADGANAMGLEAKREDVPAHPIATTLGVAVDRLVQLRNRIAGR